MRSDRFEWDDEKAESNFRKHGVTFAAATLVFNDRDALEVLDSREEYGELRYIITGRAPDGSFLVLVYTERGDHIRIISARRALRNEIARYFQRRS